MNQIVILRVLQKVIENRKNNVLNQNSNSPFLRNKSVEKSSVENY